MRVTDYIADFLAKKGVRHVFILSGGQAMFMDDSFGSHPQIATVSALHEQAAAMMAEAYSRTTDNYGVCAVTTGPGGTNAITGTIGAWLDSTPCMFLSGQVRTANLVGSQRIRQTVLQNTDPVSLVKTITKYAVLVTDPATIRYHLERAYYLSTSGRPGPVWLDLPLDVQSADVDPEKLKAYNPEEDQIHFNAKSMKFLSEVAFGLLQNATRPAILAGNGVRLGKCIPEFTRLVERLGIPVLTSINGIDLIPEDNPVYFGRPNYWGQRSANLIVQNADVLLVLGAGLHLDTTGFNHKAFARETKLIYVDIDQGELSKNTVKPDLPIHGNVADFVGMMEGLVDKWKLTEDHLAWVEYCKGVRARFPLVVETQRTSAGRVHPFEFIEALSEAAGEGDIIIPGNAGTHFTTCVQVFKAKKGQRIFSEIGIGAMGHSLPSAIAASIAVDHSRRVICITGDGGIQLNLQELQTAITYGAPIKIFMANNDGYMSLRNTQRNYFEGRLVGSDPKSGLRFPDMSELARVYGFEVLELENSQEMKGVIQKALNTPGPVFCNVHLLKDCDLTPKVGSRRTASGQMESSPLEDLSPLLDRELFKSLMFTKPLGD